MITHTVYACWFTKSNLSMENIWAGKFFICWKDIYTSTSTPTYVTKWYSIRIIRNSIANIKHDNLVCACACKVCDMLVNARLYQVQAETRTLGLRLRFRYGRGLVTTCHLVDTFLLLPWSPTLLEKQFRFVIKEVFPFNSDVCFVWTRCLMVYVPRNLHFGGKTINEES